MSYSHDILMSSQRMARLLTSDDYQQRREAVEVMVVLNLHNYIFVMDMSALPMFTLVKNEVYLGLPDGISSLIVDSYVDINHLRNLSTKNCKIKDSD